MIRSWRYSEQTGYLGRLEVGWAVVRLQGRWFRPFLVRIPLVPIAKGQTNDSVVKTHNQQSTSSNELSHGLLLPIPGNDSTVISTQEDSLSFRLRQRRQNTVYPDSAKMCKTRTINDAKTNMSLTPDENIFLRDVLDYPASTTTQRYRHLNFSTRHGNHLQQSLLYKKLITVHAVSAVRGQAKLLSLTEAAKDLLGSKENDPDRLGGPEHRYWKMRIAGHLRNQGFLVTEEFPLGGGQTVDLVAERDGKRIACEIETGYSDASSNAQKCLNAGFDQIWLIATSARVRDALNGKLPRNRSILCWTAVEVLRCVDIIPERVSHIRQPQ